MFKNKVHLFIALLVCLILSSCDPLHEGEELVSIDFKSQNIGNSLIQVQNTNIEWLLVIDNTRSMSLYIKEALENIKGPINELVNRNFTVNLYITSMAHYTNSGFDEIKHFRLDPIIKDKTTKKTLVSVNASDTISNNTYIETNAFIQDIEKFVSKIFSEDKSSKIIKFSEIGPTGNREAGHNAVLKAWKRVKRFKSYNSSATKVTMVLTNEDDCSLVDEHSSTSPDVSGFDCKNYVAFTEAKDLNLKKDYLDLLSPEAVLGNDNPKNPVFSTHLKSIDEVYAQYRELEGSFYSLDQLEYTAHYFYPVIIPFSAVNNPNHKLMKLLERADENPIVTYEDILSVGHRYTKLLTKGIKGKSFDLTQPFNRIFNQVKNQVIQESASNNIFKLKGCADLSKIDLNDFKIKIFRKEIGPNYENALFVNSKIEDMIIRENEKVKGDEYKWYAGEGFYTRTLDQNSNAYKLAQGFEGEEGVFITLNPGYYKPLLEFDSIEIIYGQSLICK